MKIKIDIPEEIALNFKDSLHPMFWEEESLKAEIRSKLVEIAQKFLDELGIDNLTVDDITLTGSLANYNWNDKSDIDLHILIDFDSLPQSNGLLKDFMNLKRMLWNKTHNIKIKDHDVEVYVQDSNEPHHSTGVYSLMNNEWITKPDSSQPSLDLETAQDKAVSFIKDVESLQRFDAPKRFEMANAIQDKIKRMRQVGLEKEGAYSPENLAFKILRRKGYLSLLREIKNNAYDEMYSLDEKKKKKKKKKEDRCTRIAKRKYDVWPSAYASGAVVKCRKGKIWKGIKEELSEQNEKVVGIHPGGFKPPHAGHFYGAKHLLDSGADEVVVIVSPKPRMGMSSDRSKQTEVTATEAIALWKLYVAANNLQDRMKIMKAESSPVSATYEYLRSLEPGTIVLLGKGDKDQEDKRFHAAQRFSDNNELDLIIQMIDTPMYGSDISGTDMREIIANGDFEKFAEYIPLSDEDDQQRAWQIATSDLSEGLSESEWQSVQRALSFIVSEKKKKAKTDYSKEKKSGLHGWFSRQGGKGKSQGWVDCNTCRKDKKTGRKKCKPCGREKGEKRSKYPACRPTPASCGTRGKGKKWGKKSAKTNVVLNRVYQMFIDQELKPG